MCEWVVEDVDGEFFEDGEFYVVGDGVVVDGDDCFFVGECLVFEWFVGDGLGDVFVGYVSGVLGGLCCWWCDVVGFLFDEGVVIDCEDVVVVGLEVFFSEEVMGVFVLFEFYVGCFGLVGDVVGLDEYVVVEFFGCFVFVVVDEDGFFVDF